MRIFTARLRYPSQLAINIYFLYILSIMRRSLKHNTLGYPDQISAERKDAYARELALGSKKNNTDVNAVHHARDSKKVAQKCYAKP